MRHDLFNGRDSQGRLLALLQSNRGRGYSRVENIGGEQADVYLYDEIGFWGTTAKDFTRLINGLAVKEILLHLNSPGGEAWEGQAIYHALKDHPALVKVRVEGIAASAASTVAMAADPGHLVMAPHSMLMIHDPWGITAGDAREHTKSAAMLDKLGDAIAGFYHDRAGGTEREWRNLMLAETWYSDREAVDAGLADMVDGDEAGDATNRFDLSAFFNTPQHLQRPGPRDEGSALTKRDVEQALRDAGLPVAAAKALLAGGWDEINSAARDERVRDLARDIRNSIGDHDA
jgi:ATP-dependent protease ClpP protease subunit